MTIIPDNLKNELISSLTSYSKYYCRLYLQCEELFEQRKGHFALFNLYTLLENLTKTVLNDYEDTFYNLNKKLEKNNLINELEYNFLNDGKAGVRKIRNILAHANLSKYDLEISSGKVTFPFTENQTCLILYDQHSIIISGIMLKLLKTSLIIKYDINVDKEIQNLKFKIITRSIEELMIFKGIKSNPVWEKFDEATKYRLLENAPDANLMGALFKSMDFDDI